MIIWQNMKIVVTLARVQIETSKAKKKLLRINRMAFSIKVDKLSSLICIINHLANLDISGILRLAKHSNRPRKSRSCLEKFFLKFLKFFHSL